MLRKSLRWLGYTLAALILLVVLLFIFMDWNWLRPPIERYVTDKTGRTLHLYGDLKVRPSWSSITVQANNITFANPSWATQPLMLNMTQMVAEISLAELFKRHYTLSTVKLIHPQIFLEQSLDGRKNWLLDRKQQDEQSTVSIDRILLDRGNISYVDPAQNTSVQADVSTRTSANAGQMEEDIQFSASGKYKGLPLVAEGSGGTVMGLNDQTTPYPLDINLTLGHTRLQAVGKVTSLIHFSTVDMNIKLSGDSLDSLYPLIGVALPRTPLYSTQGHLLHSAKQWRYEQFAGNLGKSQFVGNINFNGASQRPFLSGNLKFSQLNLADLGSPIGMSSKNQGKVTNSNTANQIDQSLPAAAAGNRKVLPELPFRTERWNSVDADVKIEAVHIQRDKALPIENLVTHVKMNDSILTLDPLSFGVAGGSLTGSIMLNGQRDPIVATAKVQARKIILSQLFPTIKLTKKSIGQLNGDFELQGTGNAVNQMLGSANGKVTMIVSSGEISKLMLETIGLHLWEMLQIKLTSDKPIQLNCAIADFEIKQGVMQTKILLLDTDITTITGTGDINLAHETLNLDLQPHTKVISPLALSSPIYIQGKFAKPEVSVDKTRIILRSAGAVALGILNPLLTIIPLIDAGPGKNSECGKLIQEAKH